MVITPLLVLGALVGCFQPPAGDGAGSDKEADDSAADDSGNDSGDDTGVDTGIVAVPDDPIVLVWFIDTLGERAAEEIDYCGSIASVVAEYGLDVDCHAGGVPASSWTLESTVRVSWPSHTVGPARASLTPACDEDPVYARVAAAIGGRYTFGADNAQIDAAFDRKTCDGGARSPWSNGTTTYYTADDDVPYQEQYQSNDALRPAHLALDDVLTWAREGEPAVALVNSFEGGGHSPRCWEDPESAPCVATWDYAVARGVVDAGEDKVVAFQDMLRWIDLFDAAQQDTETDPSELRTLFWQSTLEAASNWRDQLSVPRLRTLLDGLRDAGRLGDLQLILLGDHGESPCSDLLVEAGRDCSHGDAPNDWTNHVPVYFVPASMGQRWSTQGWIGDATVPWSLTRIPYALMADHEVALPGEWPEPEPLGQATAWACFDGMGLATEYGMRVEGGASVRCNGAACGAFEWREMVDEQDTPAAIAAPTSLTPLLGPVGGYQNWFQATCHGAVVD